MPTIFHFIHTRVIHTATVLILFMSQAVAENASNKYTLVELSARGEYRVTLKPEQEPIAIGQLHNWVLHVETTQGDLFFPKQLAIKGGMPGHGHGFPSEPQISRYLENGEFLVEGMLFNMAGLWQLRVGIDGPSGWDTVTILVTISPADSGILATDTWSQSELDTLRALSWSNAAPIPIDPSNRFSRNAKAAKLGEQLFFDPKLSASGKVSCGSCHQPQKAFSDGLPLSFGSAQTSRHSPSLTGIGRNRWFYWDGRRDSLWAQALTPIESIGEMDNNRMDAVRYVLSNDSYKAAYRSLVGSVPNISDTQRFPPGASPYSKGVGQNHWYKMKKTDRVLVNNVFVNLGKFIAAFETTLDYEPTRFDKFVNMLLKGDEIAANKLVSDRELAGIKLFLDNERTKCLRCHNGPLLSNRGFHNIGSGVLNGQLTDHGRIIGLQAVGYDIFNCTGSFSDADQDECSALRFALKRDVPSFFYGAFKVPSLRNVANTAPYLHDGRYGSLQEVIHHYRKPPEENSELQSLDLTDEEIESLVHFLNMLSSSTISQ
ncbi:cytochrome c peroxidase [Enterovibrio norvegicus]|uniref:cytochrome c peroxidase n=1 Tax=Enterovibrio norvegicus TaxID=188144 RepID=UPI0013D8828D|nr:cytochrome c peroxidase [Enterovibrio norvegicus]